MEDKLRVAALQSQIPLSHQEGEKQVRKLIEEAMSEPVDMIGLPEDCIAPKEDVEDGYNPIDFLSSLAREYSTYLFGANLLKEDDGEICNTGLVFNKEGELILRHHKVALTPLATTSTGGILEVVDTEFGKISLLVCKDAFHKYSAWFFDKLRKAGTEIVLVPSLSINVSDSQYDIDLWTDSLKALSKWFYMIIVAPGTVGKNTSPFKSFGHAMIINSGGKITVGSENEEEILRDTLDLKQLRHSREKYESKWEPKAVPQVKVREEVEL